MVAHLASRLSLTEYQNALSSWLYPIKLDLSDSDKKFRANSEIRRVGDLSMFKLTASEGFECQTKTMNRHQKNGQYLLQYQEGGKTSYQHRGRTAHCDSGRLVLLDSRNNIKGIQFGAAAGLIIKLPIDMVNAVAPGLKEKCAMPISTERGSARVLARMIVDIWCCSPSFSVNDHRMLPASLLPLVDAAFVADNQCPPPPQSLNSPDLQMLRQKIMERYADPELTVDKLAKLMNTSRSKLYGITRAAGTTIERLIVEVRLAEAEARLIDPEYAEVSVTDIAFSKGFQNLSHFSRRFKERYGFSPASYRVNRQEQQ